MNTLIVCDSQYGNTEQIAHMCAEAAGKLGVVKTLVPTAATDADVSGADVLIVGSPTQGGRPTKATQAFLEQLSAASLRSTSIAAFDTRFSPKDHGFGLRLLMRTIGFAAPRIARSLTKLGGVQVSEPAGFIVRDTKGPLEKGELERAKAWARGLLLKHVSASRA